MIASKAENPTLGRLAILFAFFSATNWGGGASARMRRAFVRDRAWIGEEEFIEMIALAQIVPGPNQTNLAVLIGQKFGGSLGAFVGLSCSTIPGFLILMVIAVVYFNSGNTPWVQASLRGCAASAVGLSIANAFELSVRSFKKPLSMAFLIATALAVSVAHLSLFVVLLTLGTLSLAYRLFELRTR